MLYTLPDLLNPLNRPIRQRPIFDIMQRLLQLARPRRPNNAPIAQRPLQRAMVQHPPIRQGSPTGPRLLRDRPPLLQHAQQRRLPIQAAIYLPERIVLGPSPRAPAAEQRGVFDQEPTRQRRVGVEHDVQLPQDGEQVGLDVPRDGVVVALVDGGQRVGVALADGVDILDVGRGEV